MATIVNRRASVNAADLAISADEILSVVEDELKQTKFIDVHTHLFMPSLGKLGLWGIDELLTYHYLEAELFRFADITPAEYWDLTKTQQADLIWRTLFVENAPLSEATRGVVAVLQTFGLSTTASHLKEAREFFADRDLVSHIREVFDLAGISEVVMTNDPLDPAEAPLWQQGAAPDSQFHAVLRLDRILEMWESNWQTIASQGYSVERHMSDRTITEVRRFLADWCARMKPVYMACSLADSFRYPDATVRTRVLRDAVIPSCREHGIPLSLMIGVRRQVNPAIRLAGDASGMADLRSLERLCAEFPDNRFLTSLLSRENQHELCVYTRKFSNLMPFGCWWFLNNPSVVEEITRERLEMLGASFIPQHSDARVLEQVLYKWRNTRRTMAPILARTYAVLAEDGRPITRADIKSGVIRLFRTNFEKFANLRRAAAAS